MSKLPPNLGICVSSGVPKVSTVICIASLMGMLKPSGSLSSFMNIVGLAGSMMAVIPAFLL